MTDDLSIGHPAAATKRSQQHKRSEDRTAAAFSTKYRSSFATVICSISASDSQVNTPIQFSRWERFCTLVASDLHLYYQLNQNLALCHKHSRHRSGREEEKNKVLQVFLLSGNSNSESRVGKMSCEGIFDSNWVWPTALIFEN